MVIGYTICSVGLNTYTHLTGVRARRTRYIVRHTGMGNPLNWVRGLGYPTTKHRITKRASMYVTNDVQIYKTTLTIMYRSVQ